MRRWWLRPWVVVLAMVFVALLAAWKLDWLDDRPVIPSVTNVASGPGPRAARSRLTGDPDAGIHVIANTTQGRFGDVSIGVGNFRDDVDYVDAAGQRRRGPTCAIWVHVEGQPPLGPGTTAYPGMTFDAGSRHFEVLAIEDDVIQLRVGSRADVNR